MDMRGLTVHPRLRPLSSPFAAVYLFFSTYFINFIAGIFRFPPVCGISHKDWLQNWLPRYTIQLTLREIKGIEKW